MLKQSKNTFRTVFCLTNAQKSIRVLIVPFFLETFQCFVELRNSFGDVSRGCSLMDNKEELRCGAAAF